MCARLTPPVWVPHATRDDFEDFSAADWARARARANWRFEALPTGALPHFEMPDSFAESCAPFSPRMADSGKPAAHARR